MDSYKRTEKPPALYDAPHLESLNGLPYYSCYTQGVWNEGALNPSQDKTLPLMQMGLPAEASRYPYASPTTRDSCMPLESVSPLCLEKPAPDKGGKPSSVHSDSGVSCPETERQSPRKSRRKSRTQSTASQAESKKTVERKGTKGKESNSEEVQEDYEDKDADYDDEKTRLRARNRKAAAKFRVRKKHDVEKLRETEEEARDLNKTLNQEAARLRSETLSLKDLVLNHFGCGDPRIDEYIQNAAASAGKHGDKSDAKI